eukprot:gene24957-biopygen20939
MSINDNFWARQSREDTCYCICRAGQTGCDLVFLGRSLARASPKKQGMNATEEKDGCVRDKRPRPRPVRVRFFKFYRAPRVRSASGPRPLPFSPGDVLPAPLGPNVFCRRDLRPNVLIDGRPRGCLDLLLNRDWTKRSDRWVRADRGDRPAGPAGGGGPPPPPCAMRPGGPDLGQISDPGEQPLCFLWAGFADPKNLYR